MSHYILSFKHTKKKHLKNDVASHRILLKFFYHISHYTFNQYIAHLLKEKENRREKLNKFTIYMCNS